MANSTTTDKRFRLFYVAADTELELAEQADDLHEAEAIIAGFDEEEIHRRTGFRLVIGVAPVSSPA